MFLFKIYRRNKHVLNKTSKQVFSKYHRRSYSTSDDLLISMAKGASITGCKTNEEMVDKVVKAGLLKNKRAINAMLEIDRKYFVNDASEDENSRNNGNKYYYYENVPIKIGNEATISTPQFSAEVLELMSPKLNPGAKVLDIGCGSGYLSAIFAVLVEKKGCVVSVDCFDKLIEDAKINIFDVVQNGVANGSTSIGNIGTIELHKQIFPGKKSQIGSSSSYDFFKCKQIVDNHHNDILYDCIYVAPCVDDAQLLVELNNLLKPSGRLVTPYYDVEKPSKGQQLLCLDKIDSNVDANSNEEQIWKSTQEVMAVLCQTLQVETTISQIIEDEKQQLEAKQVKQITKEEAKQDMLQWVANFESEHSRKPTRDDIENSSEGKYLFETFQNAVP